ncbi:MAG: DUF3352 domain-containing protein [Anaerolineales bacterium]|nr:DUF3352 domain-containing protein [Anaerolineales bacterium]
MNKRTTIIIGIAALFLCLVCVVVAGIGGYVYQDKVLALLGLAPAQKVATMLPAETQFYMSITPNIQNMAGYQNLKKLYFDNPDIQALFDEVETEMSDEAGITYENDIKPWLGTEVVIAAPDFTEGIKAQSQDPFASAPTPDFVLAAETSNKEASDNFISKVLAEAVKKDNPYTDEVYQDVTLHHQKNGNDTATLATFNNFVVASNSDALVKGMIDQAQGKDAPALADSERFKKITGELPANAVGTLYMEFAGLFEAALAESAVELPESQVKDLQAFNGFGAAGTLQPDGIQLDMVVSYDLTKMSETMKASIQRPASPNAILADIPADALFAANGFNLNLIWQSAKQSLESNPDFTQQMDDLEKELGFSVEEDIFGWMTGEYAMVLVEAAPADEFSPPMGGYVLIGANDVNQAKMHVEKVFGALEESGGSPPLESQTVQGIEMKVMADPNGAFMGGYGFHKDYFLVAYHEDAVKLLASSNENPLSGSANFKAVQSRLPGSNYGYVYADLDQVQQVIEDQLSDFEKEDYQKKVRPFLEPMHALGASASTVGVEQGMSKGAFFVLISE